MNEGFVLFLYASRNLKIFNFPSLILYPFCGTVYAAIDRKVHTLELALGPCDAMQRGN